MGIFETEITELEELNNKILKKDEEEKQTLFKFDKDIQTIKNFQLEREIKGKVEIIFAGMDKVVKNYIETEKLLYPESSTYASFFKMALNAIEPSDFLILLKNAYEVFYKAQANFSFAKYGDKENDKLVSIMAKSYLQVCYIRQNISQLIKQFIFEDKRKEQEISEKEKERNVLCSSIKEDRRELVNEAQRKMKELDLKLAEMSLKDNSLSSIIASSTVETNFADSLFYIGKLIADENEAIHLNMSAINIQKSYGLSKAYALDLSDIRGAIIVYEDKKPTDDLWNIVQALTFKWIINYPGKNKKIMAIHNDKMSRVNRIMSMVNKCGEGGCLIMSKKTASNQFWVDADSLTDNLDDLLFEMRLRDDVIGGYKNIFEYNMRNPSNAQSLIMVYIMDLDLNEIRNASTKIQTILERGKQLGIFLFFIYNSELAIENMSCLDDSLLENMPEFTLQNKDNHSFLMFHTNENGVEQEKYIDCLLGYENLNESNFENVKQQVDKFEVSFDFINDFQQLYQNSVVYSKNKNTDYRKTLIVPVGRHGTDIITMELTSDSSNAHAIIEGMTGTGKTTMLHNIILSAAYNYSPEQLEIYIFDFKQGGEDFIPYRKLKHVKLVAVNCNPAEATEYLEFVQDILGGRGGIKGKENPRVLIVVDEYTTMKPQSMQVLINMAKTIRSQGGSLLLSSQEATEADINPHIGNKFEMYEASHYRLIESASKYKNLTKKSRLVIFEKDENTCVDIKYPFVGDAVYSGERNSDNLDMSSGIGKLINIINENNSTVKTELITLDEHLPLSMNAYRCENNDLYSKGILIGEKFLSHREVNLSFKDRNGRILLIGDKTRAESFERIISDAFLSVQGAQVYYLNFDQQGNNRFIDNSQNKENVFVANNTRENGEMLRNLYNLLQQRKRESINGKNDFSPIEIIFHCAGNGDDALSLLAEIEAEEINKQSENAFSQKAQFEPVKSLSAYGLGQTDNGYPSFANIVKALLSSKLNIYPIMHYLSINEMEQGRIMSVDSKDCDDSIIIPTIPSKDESDFSIAWITQAIRRLQESGNDFDEYYRSKMQSNEINREKVRELFRYFIYFDKSSPILVMPYEYEV